MSNILRIAGISGSLRKDSWNTKLLKAFAVASKDPEFTKKEIQFEILDWSKYSPFKSLIRLPVYNQDLESNLPSSVVDFKTALMGVDGVIIVTPDVPGALKNAIDWASRPIQPGGNVWKGKVIGIAGVGPQSYEGAHGGLLAAVALRQSTMFLEWRVIDSPKICVLRAADRFNADGELKEEETHLWGNIRGMLREVARNIKVNKLASQEL